MLGVNADKLLARDLGQKFELLSFNGIRLMFTSLSNLRSIALKVALVYIHASKKSYYAKVALFARVLCYSSKGGRSSSPQRRIIRSRTAGKM